MKLSTIAVASAALLAGVAAPVHAKPVKPSFTPTYCSSQNPNPDGLSVSDMTYNGKNATDCYGVVGGNVNSAQDVLDLNLKWDVGGLAMIGDADPKNPGSVFELNGLRFTLTTDPGTAGSWLLTTTDINGSDPLNLPADLKLIAGLKASDRYALWYFDLATVDGDDTGTFKILFVNNGGQYPSLSHLVLFVDPPSPVPEPATLALLGIGMTGFAFGRRRT